MSKVATINIEDHTFEITKETETWRLSLKHSEILVNDPRELAILEINEEYFLPMDIDWSEDDVTFTYKIDKDLLTFDDLKSKVRSDQIRSMLNASVLKAILATSLTTILHPDNLLFDHNLQPKAAYRGINEKMPPVVNDELFLRQYKCLVISLFQKKYGFDELYGGTLETIRGNKFIQTIQKAESTEVIEEYLHQMYLETDKEITEKQRLVSKKKFQVYKQLSIWFGVLALLLLIPLGYFMFMYNPFEQRMLTLDTSFMKKDYETVITTAEPIQAQKLPYTQKYALAYSYVQGQDLSENQKQMILNNISLKSDADYLNYWIEIGRGNFDKALDVSKKLEDYDLILFGLMQKMEQVRTNNKISGTEKEETLSQLESDYEKYKKKWNELLETDGKENPDQQPLETVDGKQEQKEESK